MKDYTRELAIKDAKENGLSDDEYVKAVESCRLSIPPEYKSQYSGIDNWLLRRRKVLFLGKGPSLANAAEAHKDYGVIATVNEACMHVDYRKVDYAFFSDRIALINCEWAWDNIGCFVCPAMVHGDSINDEPVPLSDILGDRDNVIVTHDSQLPWDLRFAEEWINSGRLLTIDTSIMGLHFLHLIGMQQFRLLGHDGGIGYATDMPNINPTRNMTEFRDRLEQIGWMLVAKYDSYMHFYDGEIIRRRS